MISTWAMCLILLVVIMHTVFMVLEMFFWQHPRVRKLFAMSEERARLSSTLAANVGLYNGLLALGLVLGLMLKSLALLFFLLLAISAAGFYAGLTAQRSLILIQATPALIAAFMLWSSI